MIHKLKCWPAEVYAIRSGVKTCEVRRADDREFSAGDELHLYPWDPQKKKYTGEPGVAVCVTWGTRTCGPSNLYTLVDATDDGTPDVVQYERPVVVLSFRMLSTFLLDVSK